MIISIFHCESGSFAMQNIRFYRAKQPLLERKTIGFAKYWHTACYATVALAKYIYTSIALSNPTIRTANARLLPLLQQGVWLSYSAP